MVNHFSIMLQRRLREQERGEEDDDDADKPGKKKKKGGGKGGDLRIHDLDEDLEMSSDDSDNSMGDGKDPCSRLQNCQGAQPLPPNVCQLIFLTCSFRLFFVCRWRKQSKGKERQSQRESKEKETKEQ